MILQFKGFNSNWSYEEADIITYAYLNVDEITKKYRGNTRPDFKTEEDEYNWNLNRSKEMHDATDDYICRQTNAVNIIYNIGELPFSEMTNVLVVMLDDKNKHIVRVFDTTNANTSVYLLNDKGQTVQKLA